ncbi:Detected protein of unknown function [Hibiscus syriacus]|uniref:NPH3 domain-containing protein n=1 Tax=Hibiscus syriacus TaxID=106335 RepID=A0A6A2Z0V0_HIBSY|nr:Detected protein of unknown function [Hibiscus syriacus]
MATTRTMSTAATADKGGNPTVILHSSGFHSNAETEQQHDRKTICGYNSKNSSADLSCLLRDVPADSETFELLARFCHRYAVQMSADNIVPLICLSYYLGMEENHCNNNILSKAVTFFEQRAMVAKASDNPRYLGEPIIISRNDGDGGDKPNAKRRPFALDWQEDLTTLSLQLYEPIISGSFFAAMEGRLSIYKRKSQRNVIETLEKLLPHGRELLPCTLLFKMLRRAIDLEASSGCRNGFKIRIGKQLDQAKAKNLLIPSQGYAKELQYDIECIRRILKIFYGNYDSSDASGFITVAELMEEFLAEVACDIDLMVDTFVSLEEMSMAAALGAKRNSDVLDFRKMSAEACEHAAKNQRLPVRVVVQVLFMAQLQLRETLVWGTHEDEEDDDDEVWMEMEKMSIKVKDLEKDCHEMKKEITNGSNRQSKQGEVELVE